MEQFAHWGVWLTKAVLLLYSVVSVGVMLERIVNLSRIKRVEQRDYAALKDALLKHQTDAFRAYLAASQAPSAAALQAGLSHQGSRQETVREAIAQEIDMQNAGLHNLLPVLATVASTAPYVGLFGTVLGILLAFEKIARTGQTGASTVAAPIADALIATALGLGVAIPAVIAYNFLSGKANNLSMTVEAHALDLAARMPGIGAPEMHSNGDAPSLRAPIAGGEAHAAR